MHARTSSSLRDLDLMAQPPPPAAARTARTLGWTALTSGSIGAAALSGMALAVVGAIGVLGVGVLALAIIAVLAVVVAAVLVLIGASLVALGVVALAFGAGCAAIWSVVATTRLLAAIGETAWQAARPRDSLRHAHG